MRLRTVVGFSLLSAAALITPPHAGAETLDDFTVRECLNVGGEIHTPTIIAHVPCGSPDSNYKVIDKAASAVDADIQCQGDEHLDLAAGGSVCLHVD